MSDSDGGSTSVPYHLCSLTADEPRRSSPLTA